MLFKDCYGCQLFGEWKMPLVYINRSNMCLNDHFSDNGLRVLVISDPLTSLSAASCDVKVGSFQDPPDIPGR